MTYPLVGSERQPPGWPDRYLAWGPNPALGLRGWRGFVEFKGPDGSLSGAQETVVAGLLQRGERVAVARFLDADESSNAVWVTRTDTGEHAWTNTTLELMRALETILP